MSLEQKLTPKTKRHNRIITYIIAGTMAVTGSYLAYKHPEKVEAAYETIVEYFK